LEEGAEEFFLKPVRLADVSKLRPHMMKTKCKDQDKSGKQGEQEMQESTKNSSPETTTTSSPSSEKSNLECQPQQQQQQQTQRNNNNKRKSVEEGLSPERTRPRYNGLTVMSNF
jgi:two-component response regulator ARR-A family